MKFHPQHLLTFGLTAILLATLAGCTKATDQLDQPLPKALMNSLETASTLGLRRRLVPPYTSLQGINGPSFSRQGKPGVLYVGADFCPYCAALRWPLTIALMRFGTLHGLHTMRSSPRDIYPDTTTVTFAKARFTSPYIKFQAVETATRLGKPLEPLIGQAARLFRKFDAPPYAPHPHGIPFLYIGGHWLLLGSPVSAGDIGKRSWKQVTTGLTHPKSKLAKAILPQANLITAAICETTGQRPAKVCTSTGVQAAAALLPSR